MTKRMNCKHSKRSNNNLDNDIVSWRRRIICVYEWKKRRTNCLNVLCVCRKHTAQLGLVHGERTKLKSTHKYHVAGSENEDKTFTKSVHIKYARLICIRRLLDFLLLFFVELTASAAAAVAVALLLTAVDDQH